MGGSVMVIFPAFPAKGRVVAVVKATVTTAVVTCSAFLSTGAMVIDTSETVLGAAGATITPDGTPEDAVGSALV